MWSRVVEVMLGCWLAVSPFVFGHPADSPALWWNDFSTAVAVIALALCSLYRPLRYAHLLTILVGLWLIGFGYISSGAPAAPAYQNQMFVGLLLLMFAIIPNEASQPPDSWQRYRARSAGG